MEDMEYDDALKWVWFDLKSKFANAARENNTEQRDAIFEVIYNLEKIYPHMQNWYLHTFPGEH